MIRVLRQEVGDADTKILLERAVFFISIGSNDYLSLLSENSSYTPEKYVGMVIGNLTTFIKVCKKKKRLWNAQYSELSFVVLDIVSF